MAQRKLAKKVAVITGASSGVGRAIAKAYGEAGAWVALLARNREGLMAAAAEVEHAGGRTLVLPVDVADAAAVERAAEQVVAHWGRIDVWVNNAMVTVFSPAHAMRPEEYRRVTEVNYLGYVHGTLAALAHMRPRNAGVVVQVGSALAYRSIPLQSAYCASKAAIRGFTDSLRSELQHEHSGIKITTLQLPAVNTPQFEVARSRLDAHPQPVPPIYQPEVVARAAVYVALHPTRELWLTASVVKAIVGQRLLPGVLDRLLARAAWSGQKTEKLPQGHPRTHDRDNLEQPIAGDRGTHGPFDARSRAHSSLLWARTHRGWLMAGTAAALAFGWGLASGRFRPRMLFAS